MEAWQVLILLAAAIAIGWINNLAGAGGALGLLVLGELLDLSTTDANVTLRLSALTIGVAGMVGFLTRGQKIPPRMWLMGLLTVPGAVLGSYMALTLPAWIYQLSLALFLILVLLQQFAGKRRLPSEDKRDVPGWVLVMTFTYIGVHMGFIQVGFGLVCILALSTIHSRDLVQVNSAKMALVIVSALVSTTTMAFSDKFKWEPAIVLGIGAAIGSFLASRWSVRKGHGAIRVMVIAICGAVLCWLAWRSLWV